MGKSAISRYRERRQRLLDGKFNCLPLPYKRFRRVFPGIEQKKYIVVTANQKVGKSKLVDNLFVYEPLFFIMEHPEIRVKVFYFSLEMDKASKEDEFNCYLLYRLSNIVISPTDLRSTDHPVDEAIIDLLETEEYQKYIRAFHEMVIFVENERNPTGINKFCRNYAEQHGHYNFITVKGKNSVTGEPEDLKILDPDDPYTADDPEEIKIAILDNASNLQPEQGLNKMQTIEKMSKYAITLRNQMSFVFVMIQHQAQAQEGIENFKLNKIKPSSDGLADCKTTTRDANMVIGLYSPFKYEIQNYEHYDITKFRNYIRFMEIIEDRDYGASGNICPLFFNGASSVFSELPRYDESSKLNEIYAYINELERLKLEAPQQN